MRNLSSSVKGVTQPIFLSSYCRCLGIPIVISFLPSLNGAHEYVVKVSVVLVSLCPVVYVLLNC